MPHENQPVNYAQQKPPQDKITEAVKAEVYKQIDHCHQRAQNLVSEYFKTLSRDIERDMIVKLVPEGDSFRVEVGWKQSQK